MSASLFWNSDDEEQWKAALDKYWTFIKPENMALEKRMGNLDPEEIKKMSATDFYNFLRDEYFVWKYTAKNRLATTRKALAGHLDDELFGLADIQRMLFTFDPNNASMGLTIAYSIKGLGTAGASGLLALLFPRYFGTVDQFVVKALLEVSDLPQSKVIASINPQGINLFQGTLLIEIMRKKAAQLNKVNHTSYWTPRKIDMVLWASRA